MNKRVRNKKIKSGRGKERGKEKDEGGREMKRGK